MFFIINQIKLKKMKKLGIKALELSAKQVLSREQLKAIMGGDVIPPVGCASCTYKTADGNSHTVTCAEDGPNCVCPDGLGCGHNNV